MSPSKKKPNDYYAVRRISTDENARLRDLFVRYGRQAGLAARSCIEAESKMQALEVEFMQLLDSIAQNKERKV